MKQSLKLQGIVALSVVLAIVHSWWTQGVSWPAGVSVTEAALFGLVTVLAVVLAIVSLRLCDQANGRVQRDAVHRAELQQKDRVIAEYAEKLDTRDQQLQYAKEFIDTLEYRMHQMSDEIALLQGTDGVGTTVRAVVRH